MNIDTSIPLRTCYMCEYFGLEMAENAYSKYTPGRNFKILCNMNVWEFDVYSNDVNDFRRCLHTALTCAFFKQVERV